MLIQYTSSSPPSLIELPLSSRERFAGPPDGVAAPTGFSTVYTDDSYLRATWILLTEDVV